jgi:DNA repair photolyase
MKKFNNNSGKAEKEKEVFGTTEWAERNANFISGCFHNCKYCYAKEMAIRFKRKTPENWEIEEVNMKKHDKRVKKTDGYIMFPSSHDITPENLCYSIPFLGKLVTAGNKVLIVTKPHLDVVQTICDIFTNFKDNILFRFTIGSVDSEVLKFWEPNAPDYEERKASLEYAFNNGYSTSVSCEPMLDINADILVAELESFVTDSIWIGKANFLIKRLKTNGFDNAGTIKIANELVASQSDENIQLLYNKLLRNDKVKWKESIKKVVGLEISTSKGIDK